MDCIWIHKRLSVLGFRNAFGSEFREHVLAFKLDGRTSLPSTAFSSGNYHGSESYSRRPRLNVNVRWSFARQATNEPRQVVRR